MTKWTFAWLNRSCARTPVRRRALVVETLENRRVLSASSLPEWWGEWESDEDEGWNEHEIYEEWDESYRAFAVDEDDDRWEHDVHAEDDDDWWEEYESEDDHAGGESIAASEAIWGLSDRWETEGTARWRSWAATRGPGLKPRCFGSAG